MLLDTSRGRLHVARRWLVAATLLLWAGLVQGCGTRVWAEGGSQGPVHGGIAVPLGSSGGADRPGAGDDGRS